ncbi:hypothetical protein QCB44_02965 [Thiomicrorhabdus sp. zzn3]|uniref:hypothetical protein n=1 Tax=Thiomicrorhabdus sp. zzn3 TaxID=3039775 RepID=UPI00243662D6|nr:hypothetical protein [Thiomicrorhabdus sp. zzn3]MDG6777661.1 hypothetical protein [Thiomicrorhabdus sp. zzn3]
MNNIPQLNFDSLQIKANPTLGELKLQVGQTVTLQIHAFKGNLAQITLGTQTLVAEHKLSPALTGTFKALVKQLEPTLVLTLRPPTQTNQSPIPNQQPILQTAYKLNIAQQIPIHQAVQTLNQLPNLSASIQSLLNQLVEQLLKPSTSLSGRELKHALLNSGLFFEHRVNSSQQTATNNSLTKDMKAILFKLQQMALAEIAEKGESSPAKKALQAISQALNRITIQQLQQYENPQMLNLELPLPPESRLDAVQLKFYKNRSSSEEVWEVLMNLHLNHQELAFKLSLQSNMSDLTCVIWYETEEIESQIAPFIPSLTQRLQELGLRVNTVQTTKLKPSPSTTSTQVALIDISV